MSQFSGVLGVGGWPALLYGLGYLALEPAVRQRWPWRIIAWNRLLDGRLHDPMVGRDLLVGSATGMLMALLWHATALLSASRLTGPTFALGPARHVIHGLAFTAGDAVVRALGVITVLLVLRAILRRTMLAGIIATVMIGIMELGDGAGPIGIRAVFALVAAALGVALMFRFGLLAAIACAFYVLAVGRLPLTLDPNAWYFARSAVVLALLVGFAAYALRLSVGSRRWLPRLAFDDAAP